MPQPSVPSADLQEPQPERVCLSIPEDSLGQAKIIPEGEFQDLSGGRVQPSNHSQASRRATNKLAGRGSEVVEACNFQCHHTSDTDKDDRSFSNPSGEAKLRKGSHRARSRTENNQFRILANSESSSCGVLPSAAAKPAAYRGA